MFVYDTTAESLRNDLLVSLDKEFEGVHQQKENFISFEKGDIDASISPEALDVMGSLNLAMLRS